MPKPQEGKERETTISSTVQPDTKFKHQTPGPKERILFLKPRQKQTPAQMIHQARKPSRLSHQPARK